MKDAHRPRTVLTFELYMENKFVHIVEECSDYFVSFMYCGIYSILITYEYDLEY
jgi:hypothetical protein